MKVTVDASRCELHGECVVAAPEVFTIEDDKQTSTVLDPNPPKRLRSAVEEAAMACPTGAITIED